jgi:hypothetical protein
VHEDLGLILRKKEGRKEERKNFKRKKGRKRGRKGRKGRKERKNYNIPQKHTAKKKPIVSEFLS